MRIKNIEFEYTDPWHSYFNEFKCIISIRGAGNSMGEGHIGDMVCATQDTDTLRNMQDINLTIFNPPHSIYETDSFTGDA